MRLYCLSGYPNQPCFVLKFKHTMVMLDCGLDMQTLTNFLPQPLVQSTRLSKLPGYTPPSYKGSQRVDSEVKECSGQVFIDGTPEFNVPELDLLDLSQVDVLLVSNYRCMMALPYITEYSSFKGTIYATEPTIQTAKLHMLELVEYMENTPRKRLATKWKQSDILSCLPAPLKNAINPEAWRQLYNKHDVEASLSKVQMVGFNEKLGVFGALNIMPISSGYCIGSCNWLLLSDYEKISYVSGSSTLTTHPRPMEHSLLKNSDVMIMCSLTQTPTTNPDSMIREFCMHTASTLRSGGNVLVPCLPSGVAYDLFECLSVHLESCALSLVPMYFISPIADSSLAYSNIFAEWLSTSKQSKVYLPEPPFPHAELIKNGRLKSFPHIHGDFGSELKTPCVVFTGHPSLRFGNVVHFMELWAKTSSNTIIFCEPDFPYLEALAPYQPLAMKVTYCPIDTSLSFAQANKLIKDLKPHHLVVNEKYTTPPLMHPHRTELVIECEGKPLVYSRNQVLSIPVKRKFEQIEIEPKLATSLVPTEVKPGVMISMVTGELSVRDNQHILKPVSKTLTAPRKRKLGRNYLWGSIDLKEFARALEKQGLHDVKIESGPTGAIVHLPSEDTLIQIDEGSTHIICEGNESLRVKLRDALVTCLEKL